MAIHSITYSLPVVIVTMGLLALDRYYTQQSLISLAAAPMMMALAVAVAAILSRTRRTFVS